MTATELVNAYYAAFNAGDMPGFLALLSEDVIHDINQGERQMGKARFAAFMDKMNRCYRERLADIVVMQNAEAAARRRSSPCMANTWPMTKGCRQQTAKPMCCRRGRSSIFTVARLPG